MNDGFFFEVTMGLDRGGASCAFIFIFIFIFFRSRFIFLFIVREREGEEEKKKSRKIERNKGRALYTWSEGNGVRLGKEVLYGCMDVGSYRYTTFHKGHD